MARESGRSMIKNLIFLLIVAFIGFVLFKLIASSVQKTSIKSEVFYRVGNVRGDGEEVVKATILSVLEKLGVTPLSVTVTIVHTNLSFSYMYELETDYLIKKVRQQVSVSDSMKTHW